MWPAAVDEYLTHGTKPAFVTKPQKTLTGEEKNQAKMIKSAIRAQTKASAFYQKLAKEAGKSGNGVEVVGGNPYYTSSGPSKLQCCCLVGALVACAPVVVPVAACLLYDHEKSSKNHYWG